LLGATAAGSDGDAVPIGIAKHSRNFFGTRRSDAESVFVNAEVFRTADCGQFIRECL
jgi:hypothetical protein